MNTAIGDGARTAAYHQIELFLEHHFVRNTLVLQPFEEVEHFLWNVLTKQLRRYLASDALDAVVVVTQRVTRLPHSIDGKGVYIISLNRLWGVALP